MYSANTFEFQFNAYYFLNTEWPRNENWGFASVLLVSLVHLCSQNVKNRVFKMIYSITKKKKLNALR